MDYDMVNHRHKHNCEMAKTYLGADISFDQNLLVAESILQVQKHTENNTKHSNI